MHGVIGSGTRSIATKKVLDVARGENHDGTELLLWTEKESSFVEGEFVIHGEDYRVATDTHASSHKSVMRDPAKDNQVSWRYVAHLPHH